MVKVKNMQSKNGNDVPNQFIIETEQGVYFQSYNSIIALNTGNVVYLDKNYWDYSRTTSKYRSLFLNETTQETRRKIENGMYILTDLN